MKIAIKAADVQTGTTYGPLQEVDRDFL